MMIKLGKFDLREQLGRGAFGIVYRAFDTSLEVERAVKILHPALVSDPSFLLRFRREATLAARLDHPNIVPVYELGEFEGQYYLVMKYLPGGSLKDVLARQGALPYTRAAEILRQVSAGLGHAHEHKVVHRDIKPANILLEANGTARLGDFGFASALHSPGSTASSSSGGLVGTPAYMAPELWRGKPASPATDLYSLGCVVFEMLTGQTLFCGDSPAEVMTRHVLDGPQFPVIWPADVPPPAPLALARALEREPADRFASVEEFTSAFAAKFAEALAAPKAAGAGAPAHTPPMAASEAQAEVETKAQPLILESEYDSRYLSAAENAALSAESIRQTGRPVQVKPEHNQPDCDTIEMDYPAQVGPAPAQPVETRHTGGKRPWIATGLLGLLLMALAIWALLHPADPAQQPGQGESITMEQTRPVESALQKTDMSATFGAVQASATYNTATAVAAALRQTETAQPFSAGAVELAGPAATPGAAKVSPVDHMRLLYVPAGDFWYGPHRVQPDNTYRLTPPPAVTPVTKMYLHAFWIDETEITQEMYRACVEAGGCKVSNYPGSAYVYYEDRLQPMASVSWDEAAAYCKWAGRRLPTGPEWEKAARGMDKRRYPWGDQEPDPTRAYYNYVKGSVMPEESELLAGQSPYGALNMVGSLWEWVDDWVSVNSSRVGSYGEKGYIDQVRSLRGGSYRSPASRLVVYTDFPGGPMGDGPTARSDEYGFRCAANDEPAGSAAPTLTSSTTTAADRLIAFVSNRSGTYEIYAMRTDGSDLRQLTQNGVVQSRPIWSPDGKQMVFVSKRDGNLEIYRMNADGSGLINLTNNSARDDNPVWSPDGSRIAFVSDRDSNQEVYIMQANGTNPTNLTHDTAADLSPAWSPDGSQIGFNSNRSGNFDLYLINANGSRITNLTQNFKDDLGFTWSPDGRRIAFISYRDGVSQVYIIDRDGTNLFKLTKNNEQNNSPAWSPDGAQVAYVTMRDVNDNLYTIYHHEIHILDADGSNLISLEKNGTYDGDPAWSPDDQQIAFSSDRDGNWEIYIMKPDGSGLTRLTTSPNDDQHPAWQP